jgi:PAT family beta-lactamase induction signal transducer AmpG
MSKEIEPKVERTASEVLEVASSGLASNEIASHEVPGQDGIPPNGPVAGVPAPVWVATTYFAQGLPYSIVHQVAQVMLDAFGVSLQAQGLTSLYGLPWNFKFLWSPFVDRVGTAKRWLIAIEVALAALLFIAIVPVRVGALGLFARGLVAFAFLAATHDIAIDAYYLRALPEKSQASFAGLRIAAYRIAMLAAKGGLVALAGLSSWPIALAAGGGMLLVLAGTHHLLLPLETRPPDRKGIAYHEAFLSFLRQPKIAIALAFILTYRAGDALLFAMATPFYSRGLGLTTTQQGFYSGVIGTIASVVGAMAGGAIVGRFTLRRALTPIAILQSLAIPIYAVLAFTKPSLPFIVAGMIGEQLFSGIGTAALAVFLMRRCQGAHKAAHFAIASALMSVATTVTGSASGYLVAEVGFGKFFLIAFAASLPGVLFSRFSPK